MTVMHGIWGRGRGPHFDKWLIPTCASVMIKMKSYRQETLCVKMLFLGPKRTKTHLRASLVKKFF
jgi:hypothetical protein